LITQQNLNFYKLLIVVSIFCVSGCVTSPIKEAEKDAFKSGFQNQSITTKDFDLFAFLKHHDADASEMVVYIEGDGIAWKRRNTISSDPTPKNPISLKLAINDSRPLVLYLARPCQYLDKSKLEDCAPIYWSSHRYSKTVVESISEAITKVKSETRASTIEIIGYSGGGVIAMLVASFRNDVTSVITVASNLDHESWTEWHGVSKLVGSLKPYNYLAELEGVNQQHFWGGKDKIVPYDTQLSFIEKSKNNNFFKYKVMPDYSHDCCWAEHWRDILR
jgi:hypothetical protein